MRCHEHLLRLRHFTGVLIDADTNKHARSVSEQLLARVVRGFSGLATNGTSFGGNGINNNNWNQVGPWGKGVGNPNTSQFQYRSIANPGDYSYISVANSIASLEVACTTGSPGSSNQYWEGSILATAQPSPTGIWISVGMDLHVRRVVMPDAVPGRPMRYTLGSFAVPG